jgi:exodeoxyribonuclease V alpha subunit
MTEELFPAKTEQPTFTGVVRRVVFRNDQNAFTIARVVLEDAKGRETEEVSIVGVTEALGVGLRIKFDGRSEMDPKWGRQIKLTACAIVRPKSVDGIRKYLRSGVLPGVGPTTADRIVERFGEDTLEILDTAPSRLAEVKGISTSKARAIGDTWAELGAVREIMTALMKYGVTTSIANKIYKRFGSESLDVVTRYPYRLALEIDGVGFRIADTIALAVGIPADSTERATAGTLHVLHEAGTKGHCFLPRADVIEVASALLERDAAAIERAIAALAGGGQARIEDHGGITAVYPARLHRAEESVATGFLRIASFPPSPGNRGALAPDGVEATVELAATRFESSSGFKLAPAQREALLVAARSKACIITGGPGVGKTAVLRALLNVFDIATVSVKLASPTGRAAKRMSEATGRHASTIHRLLEFDPVSNGFKRGASNPIDAGAVIVDESSMLDVRLADDLLAAISQATRLILVGDVDQLPSVGPGAVLRDVITSAAIPVVRLTQIFRQAEGSDITVAAHCINRGEKPTSSADPRGDFFIFERADETIAADLVVDLVSQKITSGFGIPQREIQVLCPMHRGACGTTELNARLQEKLNPVGRALKRGNTTFRVGDRVMVTRNNYDDELFNGDVGYVESVDPEAKTLKVEVDDRIVELGGDKLANLALSYSCSVHKFQGSQMRAVVIPLQPSHFMLLSRNLVYTAVTRGERLVVVVCDPKSLRMALSETRKEDRYTLLSARLRGELA